MLKPVLANADISRLINSNEIQSVVNPVKTQFVAHYKQKKNALKSKRHMNALNPNAEETRKAARLTNEKNQQARKDTVGKKRSQADKKATLERKAASKQWLKNVLSNLDAQYQRDIEDQNEFMKL